MAIRQENFEFIRTSLHKRSAIMLSDNKQYLVESRLSALARQNGMQNVDDFLNHLKLPEASVLWQDVVDAMTTNETSFFRDQNPFEVLRNDVFPALVGRNHAAGPIKIWSAAAASGQEPYSIAMLWHECRNLWPSWDIEILASDISQQMLARGRAASYSEVEVKRGLSPERLEAHFQRQSDRWWIRDHLRQPVEFRYLNLSRAWPNLPKMDIVFLRNVLVYFDFPTKKNLFAKLRTILKPEGFLFLGGTETPLNVDDRFEPVFSSGGSCYRLKN